MKHLKQIALSAITITTIMMVSCQKQETSVTTKPTVVTNNHTRSSYDYFYLEQNLIPGAEYYRVYGVTGNPTGSSVSQLLPGGTITYQGTTITGITGISRMHDQGDGNLVVITSNNGAGTFPNSIFAVDQNNLTNCTLLANYPATFNLSDIEMDRRTGKFYALDHTANSSGMPVVEVDLTGAVTQPFPPTGSLFGANFSGLTQSSTTTPTTFSFLKVNGGNIDEEVCEINTAGGPASIFQGGFDANPGGSSTDELGWHYQPFGGFPNYIVSTYDNFYSNSNTHYGPVNSILLVPSFYHNRCIDFAYNF